MLWREEVRAKYRRGNLMKGVTPLMAPLFPKAGDV